VVHASDTGNHCKSIYKSVSIHKEIISPQNRNGVYLFSLTNFSVVKTVYMDEHELAAVLRIDPDIVIGKIAGPDVF